MEEFLKNLSVSEILQYYAVLCLSLAPLNILLVYLLYKYTNLIERFDRFLDKLFTKKGKKAEVQPKPQDEKTTGEPEPKKPVDIPELSGVSCFSLPVGQIYYCRLNSQERSAGFYPLRWFTSNEFLGKVDEESVFTAHKAGVVDVYSCRKNDDFDHGAHAYRITVVPRNPKWTAQTAIELLLNRAERPKVLAAYMGSKIVQNDPAKRLLGFHQAGVFEKVLFQFDATDNLERAVLLVSARKGEPLTEALNNIIGEMADRFDEVTLTSGEGIRLWIHRLIDEEHDEVDIYAYMRKSASVKGQWVLCIGQTWREYGEIDEFLLNIKMCEKMFADCLPNEDYIHVQTNLPVIPVQESKSTEDDAEEKEEHEEKPVNENDSEPDENHPSTGEPEAQDESENEPSAESEGETETEKKETEVEPEPNSKSEELIDAEAGIEVDAIYNGFEDFSDSMNG